MRRWPVYMSKWKDKREILRLSIKHHLRMVNCTSSRGHNKLKPMCVHDYNTHMGGVNRPDQLHSYCSTPRKTTKWYKKVFFNLLDIAVMNSYVLFNKLSREKAANPKLQRCSQRRTGICGSRNEIANKNIRSFNHTSRI